MCVCVAKPVAVELRCHATALILGHATTQMLYLVFNYFRTLLQGVSQVKVEAMFLFLVGALELEFLPSGFPTSSYTIQSAQLVACNFDLETERFYYLGSEKKQRC